MKKRMFMRNISLALVLVMFICFGVSCKEDDGSGYIFKANITYNPKNLDPQLADDYASKMIISNMYQGLVKMNSNGAIENAAAQSYFLSDDNLTYTFKLKENIFWEGLGEYTANLTAKDFVFAFERILKPNSPSPYSKEYYCIKNARAVNSGNLGVNMLGVKAVDDYTLEITLETPYYNFLELLTHTSSMPCNEDFFDSTKGRYGLAAETSISNSAFYLKEWNFDPYWDNNYIILRRNKLNHEQDMTYPYSLNFFITGNSENDIADFKSEKTDCVIADTYDKKLLSANNYIESISKSYGFLFNPKSEVINTKELRCALAMSINRETYLNVLPENLTVAYGIVPPAITVLGKSYRELIPDNAMSVFNQKEADKLWYAELKKQNAETLDNVKITVPDSFNGTKALDIIAEKWQQEYNFYCGVEVVSQIEYEQKIADESYDILLTELSADYNDASDMFTYFTSTGTKNTLGYKNMQLDGMIMNLKSADKLSSAVSLYESAEMLVISDCFYIPLFYGKEYFVYAEDAADLEYHPFTKHIIFQNGKMY